MTTPRFRRLFRLASREPSVADDVDQEIRTHLDQLTDWYVAQGWKPDAAREEARRRFGDVDRFRRELGMIDRSSVRRRRIGERLESVGQDVRLGWRGLRRSPGYAAVVIGTLGLALGANATMFGVVDRLLLQPPPGVAAPELIKRVDVARWFDDHLSEPWDAISYPSFEGLRDHSTAFSHVAAVTSNTLSYGLGAAARPAEVVFASGQYFGLLGTRPLLGRFFGEAEDAGRGMPVAVLGYGFWRDALGADADPVGRTVVLNGQPFEVIGVAPEHFTGTSLERIDLWVPLSAVEPLVHGQRAEWRTGFGWQWLNALVRKKPGVTDQEAAADATRAYRLANGPYRDFERKGEVRFRPLQAYSDASGPERIAGWLYGVTLVVLLIACANIANVVLARGIVRRGETAVRQALGISRGRLIRQLLIESGVVIGLGLLLGLVLARWGGLVVRRVLLEGTAWESDPVNGRVLLATGAAAVGAGLVASLWPLVRGARVDLAAALHGGGRSGGRLGARARGGLLLAQSTLCTALVVMAGLFLHSIRTVQTLDLGFDPARVSLVSIDLQGLGMPSSAIADFYRRAAERIRGLPGVEAAGVTFGAPFRSNSGERIRVPGKDSLPRLAGGGPYFFAVGEGTLEAFGVRRLAGRTFTAGDRKGSPPVILVSERMARTIWPGENAVGKCVIVGEDSMPCREVVGVVADLHRQGLDEPPFFLYFSVLAQEPEVEVPHHVVVRSRPGAAGVAESIRKALLAERSDLPYVEIRDYDRILAGHARPWNLGATLLTVFGVLSLVIAAIGLYGVVSFGVSQRTRELGLLAALGATPKRLVWAVVASGVATAGAGIGLGLMLALAAGGRLAPLLFRTDPADPMVLGAAGAVVVLVSAVASWIPGRRALRIDPMAALRAE